MKIKFRTRLFLAFETFGVLLLAGTIGYTYYAISDLPCRMTRNILLATASSTALAVDPADIEAIKKSPDPRSCPQYGKLIEMFKKIDHNPPHLGLEGRRVEVNGIEKEIYVLIPTGKPETGKILVTVLPNEVGQEYDMKRFPAMMKGWSEVTADDKIQEDEFGRALSAYAPIKDKNGKVIALLGIDAYGEFIDEIETLIRHGAAGMFVVAILLSFLPIFHLSSTLNKPIRLLHDAMEKVAGGDISARIENPPRTRDEFEMLITHFNGMLTGLAERQELVKSMELARGIQQNLLPKDPPSFAGFDIFGAVQYCDRTGGDYIDFVEISENPRRIGIAIGDVTGHGVSAALLMAFTRALLHSLAGRYDTRVGEMFDELNVHLARDTDKDRFMTLFYGMLAQDGSLSWVSAGHEPGILVESGGAVSELPCTNLPLAVMDDTKYDPSQPVTLKPGDVLVIGTDGIREAFGESGEQFGQERLKAVVVRSAKQSAFEIHRAIIDEVRKFLGKVKQADDIALIVIKRLAS